MGITQQYFFDKVRLQNPITVWIRAGALIAWANLCEPAQLQWSSINKLRLRDILLFCIIIAFICNDTKKLVHLWTVHALTKQPKSEQLTLYLWDSSLFNSHEKFMRKCMYIKHICEDNASVETNTGLFQKFHILNHIKSHSWFSGMSSSDCWTTDAAIIDGVEIANDIQQIRIKFFQH